MLGVARLSLTRDAGQASLDPVSVSLSMLSVIWEPGHEGGVFRFRVRPSLRNGVSSYTDPV